MVTRIKCHAALSEHSPSETGLRNCHGLSAEHVGINLRLRDLQRKLRDTGQS